MMQGNRDEKILFFLFITNELFGSPARGGFIDPAFDLVWNRTKKLITSDVFVKITTENNTIYGENGMEADERFDSWKLKKVRGDILVKDDTY